MKDSQLINAVELLNAIVYSTLNRETYVEPILHERISEFLDDYYSEESLLNEAFSKAIIDEMKDFDIISTVEIPMSNNPEVKEVTVKVINKLSQRVYEASYYYNGDQLEITNKFKEV